MGRTQAQKRRDKKLYSERDEERTNSVSPSLLGHVEKKLKENMKELNLEIEKGKDKIKYQMRATKTKTTKTLRKLVTGEEDKKVRDFAKEKMRQRLTGDKNKPISEYMKEPKQIRTFDKMAFLWGVCGLALTEWVMLVKPLYFMHYKTMVIAGVIIFRYIEYKKHKWEWFLIDFCYFVNLLSILQYYLLPTSYHLAQALFVLANGPLLSAIVSWKNSYVFHSVDKIFSLYIHILPAISTWCRRWQSPQDYGPCVHAGEGVGMGVDAAAAACDDEASMLYRLCLLPILVYVLWQVVHIFITEVEYISVFRDDPEVMTSMRWLTTSGKNGLNKLARGICYKFKMLEKGEMFDPEALQTKIVFWSLQFVYTLVFIFPAMVMFHYEAVHIACILSVFLYSVYNGGSYYIEVFSKRYAVKRFAGGNNLYTPPATKRRIRPRSEGNSNDYKQQ